MVSERDRILKISQYIESCGVCVNIAKNKALGNKGFFKAKNFTYRIDIAKKMTEDSILKTLTHEFAHYVHYTYDNSLKSLEFIFPSSEIYLEELISITVHTISKNNIEPLFTQKELLKKEIFDLVSRLQNIYPDLKENVSYKKIENKINKLPYRYLLKYDKVKVVDFLGSKLYTLDNIVAEQDVELYLKLKSRQRNLKRVNSKIARLNKYYNLPTELFARSFETYVYEPELLKNIAPNVFSCYQKVILEHKIPLIENYLNIFNENLIHSLH